MVRLNIRVDETGTKVKADTGSVSGTAQMAGLIRAVSLPLNLLNEVAATYFSDNPPTADSSPEPLEEDPNTGLPKLDLPVVSLVPTLKDGMLDLPRQIQLQVANGPRDANEDTPEWFVRGVRAMFPDYDWEGLNEPVDQKLLDDLRRQYPGGKNEFDEDVPVFTFVSDGHDLTAETAVQLFYEAAGRNVTDHSGFVGVGDQEVFVAEPYGLSLEEISKLAKLVKKADWTFRILGVSAHYPSATLRLEIRPKQREVNHA
jgi:hypothetical protein